MLPTGGAYESMNGERLCERVQESEVEGRTAAARKQALNEACIAGALQLRHECEVHGS